MIDISISRERISIAGHAGYAPRGQDIVCAAITALTQTFRLSVQQLTEDKIYHDISPGVAYIYTGNLGERAQLLEDSFFVGCQSVADEFPDYVRVSRSGNTLGTEQSGATTDAMARQ